MVKVLDFGLAKVVEQTPVSDDPWSSSTLTFSGTSDNRIRGSAAYMSPEHARGHEVDRRADIWAFGVVVYEMLAGVRAFKGGSIADVLAALLTKEPDWDALAPATPSRGRELLRRCLTHDRRAGLKALEK